MPKAENEATPLRGAREPVASRQYPFASTTTGVRLYGPCFDGSRRHDYISVGESGDEEYPRVVGRMYGSRCVRRPWYALALAVTAAVGFHAWWTVGDKDTWIQEQHDNSGGMFEAVPSTASQPDPEQTNKVGSLELMATNEYGEYDRRAASLYGLEMVVEPFKETTVTVLNPTESSKFCNDCNSAFHWSLVQTAPDGTPLQNLQPVLDIQGPDSSVTITLPEAKTRYSLLVRQLNLDDAPAPSSSDGVDVFGPSRGGVVIAEQKKDVYVKYVRRELRELTKEDLNVYFSTMAEFYGVSIRDGKAKYGTAFGNSDLMAAYHNSRNYCFHSGMHFLNAHVAFDLWGERSMQMINPKFALHYWDFTIDAANLGTNWPESEVFSDDMFGSAMGDPENMYQIKSGWFKDVTSLYDPDMDFELDFIDPGHNAFGFIDAQFNYQSLSGIARTNSYCGLKGEMEFATCNKLIGCFDDNDNIYDWTVCMEDQVHASNHGMLGGSFGCNTDMGEFHGAHPEYGSGLLSFVLEYITVHRWPSNFMSSYNKCDMSCDLGDDDCGCVCNTDIDAWTDDEVYDYMSSTMSTLFERAHGAKYIHVDETADRVYTFKQDGVVLGDGETILLLRTLMTIGCEPGMIGAMSVGPSNLDPIFWALHPLFEKATHVLLLSPTYNDTYDFTWVGKDCGDGISGGQVYEEMPFSERELGFGDGTDLLTNEEIQQMLHPSNPKMPYLYDKFGDWGTCDHWDFDLPS